MAYETADAYTFSCLYKAYNKKKSVWLQGKSNCEQLIFNMQVATK